MLALTDDSTGSPVTYALTYDASGNVTQMFDAETGALVASYSYAPYGASISASGPDAALNPWGYKGYWTDAVAPGIVWSQPNVYGVPATAEDRRRHLARAGPQWNQRRRRSLQVRQRRSDQQQRFQRIDFDPVGRRQRASWTQEALLSGVYKDIVDFGKMAHRRFDRTATGNSV